MSGPFESMVNEMARWNTKPEVTETAPAAEAPESELMEDVDELDSEEELAPWPSSSRSDPMWRKKVRTV
jgi:hypothetical protein